MAEPFELTATEAARSMRQRELSPVELAESLLRGIDTLEPQLKAWVYLDRETVLSEARQKEAELASGGDVGPLHGVPVGLKDIYYTAGIPTTACSKLYADFVPEYDATTVAMMKQAGGHHARQDSDHRVCLPRPVAHHKSLEPGPHPRWLQQRLCGGCGHPYVSRRDGFPDGGIGAAPGLL